MDQASLELSRDDLPAGVQASLQLHPPPERDARAPAVYEPRQDPTFHTKLWVTQGPCTILPLDHPALRP